MHYAEQAHLEQTAMNDGSNLILFFVTQLVLPLGLAHVYCRCKGIPARSWQAGAAFLVALSAAMLLFTGVLGLPTHVKNVGFMSNRPMGLTCGAIGIVAGLVMGWVARHFEGKPER